jgi:hypothetical protein
VFYDIEARWGRLCDNRMEAAHVQQQWSEWMEDRPPDAPDGPLPPWIPSGAARLRDLGLDGYAERLGKWGEAARARGKAALDAVRDWRPQGDRHGDRYRLGRIAHRLARMAVGEGDGDVRDELRKAWESFGTGGRPFPAGCDDGAMIMLNGLVAEGGGLALIHKAVVAAPARPTRPKMTVEEADRRARRLAKASPSFAAGSQRDWAARIGCGIGQVGRLPFWQETMAKTGRGRGDRAAAPSAVGLTPAVLATQGAADPRLEQLLNEHRADYELSPLDDDPPDAPRRVRNKKRL